MTGFFDKRCCKKIVDVNTDLFGICDNESNDSHLCAFISTSEPRLWTAEVTNKNRRLVTFFPIDFRLTFFRTNMEPDNICDCMLVIPEDSKLLFIELKDSIQDDEYIDPDTGRVFRKSWLNKALIQLEQTIIHFKIHHLEKFQSFKKKEAHIANKARPVYNGINPREQNDFKNKTGFRLYTSRFIEL